MDKLVGQQIECRITKLDTATEDVVVDRRAILEELERAAKEEAAHLATFLGRELQFVWRPNELIN